MRISEIGYPSNMICLRGMGQRLEERIRELQRERRKKSPYLQPYWDIRIKAVQMLNAQLDEIWDSGKTQIRRKHFEELEDRIEQWRTIEARRFNANRNLARMKSKTTKAEAENEKLKLETAHYKAEIEKLGAFNRAAERELKRLTDHGTK